MFLGIKRANRAKNDKYEVKTLQDEQRDETGRLVDVKAAYLYFISFFCFINSLLL